LKIANNSPVFFFFFSLPIFFFSFLVYYFHSNNYILPSQPRYQFNNFVIITFVSIWFKPILFSWQINLFVLTISSIPAIFLFFWVNGFKFLLVIGHFRGPRRLNIILRDLSQKIDYCFWYLQVLAAEKNWQYVENNMWQNNVGKPIKSLQSRMH